MLVKALRKIEHPLSKETSKLWHVWDKAEEVCFPEGITAVPLLPFGAHSHGGDLPKWLKDTKAAMEHEAIAPHHYEGLVWQVHWLFTPEIREAKPKTAKPRLKDWVAPQTYFPIAFLRQHGPTTKCPRDHYILHVVMCGTEAYICDDNGDTIRAFNIRHSADIRKMDISQST